MTAAADAVQDYAASELFLALLQSSYHKSSLVMMM
jgi:hypothetical protein